MTVERPLGWRAFQLGLFLLPSSALLAGLCLLVTCITGSRGRAVAIWRDPWVRPLLLAGLLMIAGCFAARDPGLAWAGLANWLPLFWAFWAFRCFLDRPERRQRAATLLLVGTVPVLVTGFGQMHLGWSGPWQWLGGGVIWFMEAGGKPDGRLSGLFDYANVAGAWLGVIWPFALAGVMRSDMPRRTRVLALLFSAATVAAVLLTRSRNAMAALALALPVVIGPGRWIWLLPLVLVLALPLLLAVLPGVPTSLQQWCLARFPEVVQQRLLERQTTSSLTRVAQWSFAIELIAERPWLGWGAAAFSVLYSIHAQRNWHGHSHNLPLELAVHHGLPAAVLVVGTVLVLLIVALRRGLLQRHPVDRAWWAATLVLVGMHGTDLPFFDSRLNILGWVLLAGLCAAIEQKAPPPPALDRGDSAGSQESEVL
ncbi:MAG: O-antigen ligase family protein [Synechococcus sp.]